MTPPAGRATILRANALSLPLADASVSLAVTSPPYWGLRAYTDGGEAYVGQVGAEASPAEFLEALWAVMAECWRVLRDDGSVWVNLGDKFATPSSGQSGLAAWSAANAAGGAHTQSRAKQRSGQVPGIRAKSLLGLPWRFALGCIDDNGKAGGQWILREEVIWAKPNGLPESVRDRTVRSHEQWFHFTKNERYFADLNPVREAYSPNKPWGTPSSKKQGAATAAVRGHRPDGHQVGLDNGQSRAENPLGKLPRSVWTVATEPLRVPDELGVDHFAAFPSEFPRRIVLGWSRPGDVVLDPFGGTGTTAAVAAALGRHGVSVDLSADYCRLAQWRVTDPKLAAKVQARSTQATPAPQPAPAARPDALDGVDEPTLFDDPAA